MALSQIITTALSIATPLLVLAFTFGRLSQKADALKEAVKDGFDRLSERETEQDRTLVMHHGRLVSLEEWRRISEGKE